MYSTEEEKLNLLARLQTLEEEVRTLKQDYSLINWVKLSEAAKILKVSTHTLRRRIYEAQINPRQSPYKKGVHWSGGDNSIYRINLATWKFH